MSPIDVMAEMWDEGQPSPRSFLQDLYTHLHLESGFVFSTPSFFMMGRPVDLGADHFDILNPSMEFKNPNAWFVYGLAGDFREAMAHVPYYLPAIGWERRDSVKWWPMNEFLNKVDLLSQTGCNRGRGGDI